MQSVTGSWYEDDSESEDTESLIDQYDITATPNDFNILTLYNFIESGSIKIPGFQRHFVWDQKRASKLIESFIIGLPVPQIFLYEEKRNKFLVIDGQQRLMSIYYFFKQRFPLKEKRPELRRIFDEMGVIPDDVLHNDKYFSKFNLQLPSKVPNQPNRFDNLNYLTLGEYRTTFELRPIRNIIVKQMAPKDNDSSIYEIFNRLNSGGVNLNAQEIRMSLYHSMFFDMLSRINTLPLWRNMLNLKEPDVHVKDVEFLLRGFAMLELGDKYADSMIKFLNGYAKQSQLYKLESVQYLESLFESFLAAMTSVGRELMDTQTNRFSVTVYESIFYAVCRPAYENRVLVDGKVDASSVDNLRADTEFVGASQLGTTSRRNVTTRLQRAKLLIHITSE